MAEALRILGLLSEPANDWREILTHLGSLKERQLMKQNPDHSVSKMK
jgi:hypothetical protein